MGDWQGERIALGRVTARGLSRINARKSATCYEVRTNDGLMRHNAYLSPRPRRLSARKISHKAFSRSLRVRGRPSDASVPDDWENFGIPTKPRGLAEASGEGGFTPRASPRIAGDAGCNSVSRVKRDHYRAEVIDPAGVYDGINIARCRRRLGNRGEIDASPPRVFLLRRPLFFPRRGALMQRVKPNRRGILARHSLRSPRPATARSRDLVFRRGICSACAAFGKYRAPFRE